MACERAQLWTHADHDLPLDRVLDGYSGRISGGQRQRIAIARALAASPQFVLLDEPTSALDAQTEEGLRDTLAQLKRDGTGLGIVTHRPALLAICDTVLELDAGRTTALRAGPASPSHRSSSDHA